MFLTWEVIVYLIIATILSNHLRIFSCAQIYDHAVTKMELTLDQALQKGIEDHKAGKLQEADRYYTAILKANPNHPDANHNMGVLAVGVGKVQEALPFFKTALDSNSSVAQYWISYIDALIKLERIDDAKVVLEQAKSNGAKGDGFDQIKKRLGSLTSKNSTAQVLPKEELNALIKALIELGELTKVKTPTMNTIYRLAKILAEKRGCPNG